MTDRQPVQFNNEDVVKELCTEPLGKALWERAQMVVIARAQAARIDELERQGAAPTEPPSPGWDVPNE